MSQRELADALGVHVSSVRKWEDGTTVPEPRRLQPIADVLGVTKSYLLGEDPTQVTIGGVAVSGPPATLSLILQGLADPQSSSPEDIIASGIRPNPRHAGLHKLLDAIDDGTYMEWFGLALTPEDEAALRTYGRSGPPVQSVAEALRVVASIQNARRPAPREDEVEPGVRALLEDEELVAKLELSADEVEAFRAVRWGGRIATVGDALALRGAVLAIAGRVRDED
jgi:transcriptional regulator with XRE-family HTH domain